MKIENIKSLNTIYVYENMHFAGILQRTERGAFFEYDESFLAEIKEGSAFEISFNLPASKAKYKISGDNLHPFFAGLLPEGLRLNTLISVAKTSPNDMFSLLAASGSDCVGDVYVKLSHQEDEPSESEVATQLEDSSFYKLFEDSISSEDYNKKILDISVPGVQPKISSEMISFPLKIKKRNKKYILKLAPDKFPRLIQNEHFFMQAAKKLGINVAKTQIVFDKNKTPGLLVERFDRHSVDGNEYRMHQEDACQFLNRYPQDKYRLSMREISEGIVKFSSSPIIEIANLIRLKVFNYLIGNGDFHAKNISLIREHKSNKIILSPAYDIVSTFIYGDENMALNLEGRNNNFSRKNFYIWGERFGVRRKSIDGIIDKLASGVANLIPTVELIGFDRKKTEILKAEIEKRVGRL